MSGFIGYQSDPDFLLRRELGFYRKETKSDAASRRIRYRGINMNHFGADES